MPPSVLRAAPLLVLGIALSACGGSEPGTVNGNVSVRSACQQDFSASRVDSNEQCAPRYADFCPSTRGDGQFTYETVVPCDGVIVEEVAVDSAESFSGDLQYLVMRPADAAPEAVMVNLHFRQIGREPHTAAATQAVLTRMGEVVKGRNAMVVLPGAPGGVWPQSNLTDLPDQLTQSLLSDVLLSDLLDETLSGSALAEQLTSLGVPVGLIDDIVSEGGTLADLGEAIEGLSSPINSVQDFMDYIELTHEHALARYGVAELPQFISGLSNGGLYALRFACERPEGFDAVMSVAGSMGPVEAAECVGGQPIGTVQVHGGADLIAPYNGVPGAPVRGGSLLPEGLDIPLREELPLPPVDPSELLALPGLFLDVFAPKNNCSGALRTSIVPAGAAGRGELAGDIFIERFERCVNPRNRKSFLVTVERGGHSWPGYDAPSGSTVNAFGTVSYDFDATLYGYDLLRQAAGLD